MQGLDALSAGVDLVQGQYGQAGVRAVAALPGAGSFISKGANLASKAVPKLAGASNVVGKAGKVASKVPQSVAGGLHHLVDHTYYPQNKSPSRRKAQRRTLPLPIPLPMTNLMTNLMTNQRKFRLS